MKYITFLMIMLSSSFVYAGSFFTVTVYQVEYNSEENSRIEIQPVWVVADISAYEFGYAVFAEWRRPSETDEKGKFEYRQSNIGHFSKLKIDINPVVEHDRVDVYLDYSDCKQELEIVLSNVKAKDLVDAVGYALLRTYTHNSGGQINKINLNIKGLEGYGVNTKLVFEQGKMKNKFKINDFVDNFGHHIN